MDVPVVIAPNKDGILRFCLDYRKLNAITQRYSYPLQQMGDCMDSLEDASIFQLWTLIAATGKLRWSRWIAKRQPLPRVSNCISSLACRLLRKAPATFQHIMGVILSNGMWQLTLVYLNEIVVFSRKPEDHLEHT